MLVAYTDREVGVGNMALTLLVAGGGRGGGVVAKRSFVIAVLISDFVVVVVRFSKRGEGTAFDS